MAITASGRRWMHRESNTFSFGGKIAGYGVLHTHAISRWFYATSTGLKVGTGYRTKTFQILNLAGHNQVTPNAH